MTALKSISEHPIAVNYANAQEHVQTAKQTAKQNNWATEEWFGANYYHLPYAYLPGALVKYMAMGAAEKSNCFAGKRGVSKYYCPPMIMHRKNLDWHRHCQFLQGKYMQATREPDFTNTNATRSLRPNTS